MGFGGVLDVFVGTINSLDALAKQDRARMGRRKKGVDPNKGHLIVISVLPCGTGHSLMYHTSTSLFLDSFSADVCRAESGLSTIRLDVDLAGGGQVSGEMAHRFRYNFMFLIVVRTTLTTVSVYALSSIPVWRARYR